MEKIVLTVAVRESVIKRKNTSMFKVFNGT